MVVFNHCPRCREGALYTYQVGGGFICFNCNLKVDRKGKTNDTTEQLINKLIKENQKLKHIIEGM